MFALDSPATNESTPPLHVRARKPTRRLLLIDDDCATALAIDATFHDQGYELLVEPDAAAAVKRCRIDRPDVVVFDMHVRGMDGIALCKEIRECTPAPFVVFTASTDAIDRIVCLQLGADEFLTKPLQPRVLVAHLDALIRRGQPDVGLAHSRSELDMGPYWANRMERRMRYRGTHVHLATTEFDLFWILVNHYGNVVDRSSLMRRLKMSECVTPSRALDGRAFRLRRRLEEAGAPSESVKAVRNLGFMLTAEDIASDRLD